jgi:hypothetical protein
VELPRCYLADAPDLLDRQRMEEVELLTGRHVQEPVGLGHAARHLRDDLRRRDADRQREAELLTDGLLEACGDLERRPGDPLQPAHVEERLLEPHALDDRGRVTKHVEQRLARLDVRIEPGRDDDQLGAEPPCPAAAHRTPHAVPARLVARRHQDAAADRNRPAAQARVVPLLDRRKERVGIRVHDPGLAGHERMFARESRW